MVDADLRNIIGQIEVRLERGSNQTKAVVQIQIEAPVQLLIGTDLLSSLGILFLLFNISKPRKIVQEVYNSKLPAIKEQGDIEKREDLNTTEALILLLNHIPSHLDCL